MSSVIMAPGPSKAEIAKRQRRDFNLWKSGFEAGERLMIEKALEWFKERKEEMVTSLFDEFEIKFRKAMEE